MPPQSPLPTLLEAVRYLGYQLDTDFVDRLHSFVTANSLIAAAVFVSSKQFAGKPIECAAPAMFPKSWLDYAENFCWAKDTYFVPWDERVASDIEVRRLEKITYYPYVPFYLLLQALCFRLPNILWNYMAGLSGVRIAELVRVCLGENNISDAQQRGNMYALCSHLSRALKFHKKVKKRQKRFPWLFRQVSRAFNLPYTACYVTALYLLVKLMYIANCALQLRFINVIFFNGTAFDNLLSFYRMDTTEIFPLTTLCDVIVGAKIIIFIRVLPAQNQMFTLHCMLSVNLFNSKIFVLLIYWLLLLLAVTSVSFTFWSIVLLSRRNSRSFVAYHLQLSESLNYDELTQGADLRRFVDEYLCADGIFVLRMILMHSGVVTATQVMKHLWVGYFKYESGVNMPIPASLPPKFGYSKAFWKNVRDERKNDSSPGRRASIKHTQDDMKLGQMKKAAFARDIADLYTTNATLTAAGKTSSRAGSTSNLAAQAHQGHSSSSRKASAASLNPTGHAVDLTSPARLVKMHKYGSADDTDVYRIQHRLPSTSGESSASNSSDPLMANEETGNNYATARGSPA